MALQTVTLGDAITLSVPMRTGGAAFTPAAGYQLIFTAKLATSDADVAALIQKKSGGFGITESGSSALIELLPIDTSALSGDITLYCDIQAQSLTDASVIKTVALFQLLTVRDVTRDTDTSIPVYTSEPPGIAYIKAEAQSGSFTAVANFQYTLLATGTVTDPATAEEGDAFTVFVSAGTGTIGGTAYPAEAIIIRSYESAAWKNTAVGGVGALQNLVEDTTPQLGGNLDRQAFDSTGTGRVIEKGVPLYYKLAHTGASGMVNGGGILSINGDATKFDLTAGSGYVVDIFTDPDNPVITDVSWDSSLAVSATYAATTNLSWILLDDTGALVQQNTEPTRNQHRTHIIVGLLVHPGSSITATSDQSHSVDTYLAEDLAAALGNINISGNNFIAASTDLTITRAAGVSFGPNSNRSVDNKNPNYSTSSIDASATFLYLYNDGAGEVSVVLGQTDIDPDQYDDGSGTLASVPNNKWTNQWLYYNPNSGVSFVRYGTTIYNSLALAEAAKEDAPADIGTGVTADLIRTVFSIKKGETDLTSANIGIHNTGRFGLGTGGGSLAGGVGSGDVVGPASSVDNAIARFDSTTGKIVQNSGATVDDSGNVNAPNTGANAPVSTAQQAAIHGITVASHGASPSATASANVTAIQAALDAADSAGGGTVYMDAGTYGINATLFIGSNTTLIGSGHGTTIQKASGTFSEILLNKEAIIVGDTLNQNITVQNITFDRNNLDALFTNLYGLRGLVTFYKVDGLILEGCFFVGVGAGLYCTQYCRVNNGLVRRNSFISEKDGVHMGARCTNMVVEDNYLETSDDGMTLYAWEWPDCPDIGDCENIVIRNNIDAYRAAGQVGSFIRVLPGVWDDWTSGREYWQGAPVVNAGNIYRNKSGSTKASPVASTVAPVHTSGAVTGADGIEWLFVRVGTDKVTTIKGLRLENNKYFRQSTSSACQINLQVGYIDGNGYGSSAFNFGNPEDINISGFEVIGGEWASIGTASFIACTYRPERLLIKGLKYRSGAGYLVRFLSFPEYTSTTDPRPEETVNLDIVDCDLTEMAASHDIGAAQNTLSVMLRTHGNLIGAASSLYPWGEAAFIFGNCDIPIEDLTDHTATHFARATSADLIPFIRMFGVWIPEPRAINDALLGFGTTGTASGTGAIAEISDKGLVVNAGTDATGLSYRKLNDSWPGTNSLDGMGGPIITKPWMLTMRLQLRTSTGVVRWTMFDTNTPKTGAQEAFEDSKKGIGMEFGIDGGNQSVRIIYSDGTDYKESAWASLGQTPGVGKYADIVFVNHGDGRLVLFGNANSLGTVAFRPVSPVALLSVTDGPTGQGTNIASNSYLVAAADGSTAPTTNQCYARLVSPPIFTLLY